MLIIQYSLSHCRYWLSMSFTMLAWHDSTYWKIFVCYKISNSLLWIRWSGNILKSFFKLYRPWMVFFKTNDWRLLCQWLCLLRPHWRYLPVLASVCACSYSDLNIVQCFDFTESHSACPFWSWLLVEEREASN